MSISVILVGVGGRGRWAVEVFHADPRWTIVALVEPNADFLESALQYTGLPKSAGFSSLSDAVKSVDADAVIACTPTRTHGPLGREAFAAGMHYLVEKGMTFDWEEAKALVREAEIAGVKFCVAQNYRYHASETAVSACLADSSSPYHPGPIEIVDLIHHRYRPEPRTLNYPYAMVWDMSCHHVDLLSAWLGPAEEVTAVATNPTWSSYEYDANIAAIIRYESGAVCHYVLTHAATVSDYRLVLQGPKGTLRAFDRPRVQFFPTPTAMLGSSEGIDVPMPSLPRGEQGVVDDFYRYIVDGIEPGISGRNNLKTLAVCEMLVRSASKRRTVRASELD